MSRKLDWVAAFAVGLALASPAHAQKAKAEKPEKQEMAAGGLYKCVDSDGAVTYTNVGSVKGCKKVEGEVNMVSIAKPAAAASSSSSAPRAKVDVGAQRVRDNDRRRILEDELGAEQKRLDDLKKEFNNGEPERQGDERNYQKYVDRTDRLKADVARSEANIDSLRRELGNLKD